MTPPLRIARLAAPLVAAALAVAGCGDGTQGVTAAVTGSTLGTLAPEDGQPGPGYDADPREYLTDAQRAELKRAAAVVPVLAPRWLPEWTRDVPAQVFVWDPDGAVRGWTIRWEVPYDSGHEIVQRVGGDGYVTLDVSANVAFGESLKERARNPASPPLPTKAGAARTYFWGPDFDHCIVWGPDNQPDTEDDAGVEGVTPEAKLTFPGPTDVSWYEVELSPGPACSRGAFTVADMLKIADSLEPLF